jgi:putative aldouronate transport system permease protein
MTVTIIVVLPILMVYPFFQRFFVKGIMIGAVKG